MAKKPTIEPIKDPITGELTGIDINNSARYNKAIRGKEGKAGAIGAVGAKGSIGDPGPTGASGRPGKDISPIVQKELEKKIHNNTSSLSSAKKDTKNIREDIVQLDENINQHISDDDVHFNNKKEKQKIIDHLKEDHTTQIISGGGGVSEHNQLRNLQGGSGSDFPKEFYHLTKDDHDQVVAGYTLDDLNDVSVPAAAHNDILQYNNSTNTWENKDSLTLGINDEANINFDGDDLNITLGDNPSLVGQEGIIRLNNNTLVTKTLTATRIIVGGGETL